MLDVVSAREPAGARLAIVAAHPDDETVSAAATLMRTRGALVITVTDGAPLHGCADRLAMKRVRRTERAAALAIAGIRSDSVLDLGYPDQGAALALPGIAEAIESTLAAYGITSVLTHAYEGGHPDHDAVAFAVHAAAYRMAARGGTSPALLEFPSYHEHGGVLRIGTFAQRTGADIEVRLGAFERARKRGMYACYWSQRAVVRYFPVAVERLRPAPAYDFDRLPNEGHLWYERYAWGMTGDRWLELVRGARDALAVPASPELACSPS